MRAAGLSDELAFSRARLSRYFSAVSRAGSWIFYHLPRWSLTERLFVQVGSRCAIDFGKCGRKKIGGKLDRSRGEEPYEFLAVHRPSIFGLGTGKGTYRAVHTIKPY